MLPAASDSSLQNGRRLSRFTAWQLHSNIMTINSTGKTVPERLKILPAIWT